jgi:hypothetical protein
MEMKQQSLRKILVYFAKERDLLIQNTKKKKKVTSWGRVLPEELRGPQLVKKLPAFCGTRRCITACTRAIHLPAS